MNRTLLALAVLAGCGGECPPCPEAPATPTPPKAEVEAAPAADAEKAEELALMMLVPGKGIKGEQTKVAVVGTGLTDGAKITIGGKDVTGVEYIGSNAIVAVAPNDLAEGAHDVVLTPAQGEAITLTGGFGVEMDKSKMEIYTAAREEIMANVAGIKKSLEMYDGVFGGYVAQKTPVPRAKGELDGSQVDWKTGTEFDTLGWSADGKVYGTYWVEVNGDESDFTVHGMVDADEDGTPAEVVATKSSDPKLKTPEAVY